MTKMRNQIAKITMSVLALVLVAGCGTSAKDGQDANPQPGSQQPKLVTSIEVALPPTYEDANAFSEGLVWVMMHGKWGAVDKDFNQVIDFLYDDVLDFSQGRAGVSVQGKWGFVDNTGKIIVEPTYIGVRSFSEGFATALCREIPVEIDPATWGETGDKVTYYEGEWAVIDQDGKEIFPCGSLNEVSDFNGGVAAATRKVGGEKPRRESLIVTSTGGEIVLDESLMFSNNDFFDEEQFLGRQLSMLPPFSEGRREVCTADYERQRVFCGYVDTSGTLVIEPRFAVARPFHDGLAVVGSRDEEYHITYSVINTAGEDIPLQYPYSEISDFSEGFSFVKSDEYFAWGIIDTKGTEVVPPIFDIRSDSTQFHEGLKLAYLKRIRWIDTTGATVLYLNPDPPDNASDEEVEAISEKRYIDGSEFSEGVARVVRDGDGGDILIGYINTAGQELVEPIYYGAQSFQEGYAAMFDYQGMVGFLKITG
ncbi:MAG: WG repeat-containing protein [Propionibacteriaceae bacterium]|nr:WG repeat-containing protein [Propionibacteriaceae bacterium]